MKNWKNDFENLEELFNEDANLIAEFDAEINRDVKEAGRKRREKEKLYKKYRKNESRWN